MDIPSWAVRGAKVICIVDDFDEDPAIVDTQGLLRFPRLGFEYTIREVRVRYVSERSVMAVGILLREIENPIADYGSATGEGRWVLLFRVSSRSRACVLKSSASWR